MNKLCVKIFRGCTLFFWNFPAYKLHTSLSCFRCGAWRQVRMTSEQRTVHGQPFQIHWRSLLQHIDWLPFIWSLAQKNLSICILLIKEGTVLKLTRKLNEWKGEINYRGSLSRGGIRRQVWPVIVLRWTLWQNLHTSYPISVLSLCSSWDLAPTVPQDRGRHRPG